MIKLIRAAMKQRRESRAERRYQAGYDWAAGALLRGTSPHDLDMHLDNPFDSNEFDAGGHQAMRDFNRWVDGRRPFISQPARGGYTP